MARDVEALVLQMSADLRRFEKSMEGMRRTADRRLAEVERRAAASQKNLSRLTARMGDDMVAGLKSGLGQLAPTIAAAFSTAQVLKYADSYTALQNRLRAAGLEGAALKKVEDELYAAANRNGLEVSATAELYSRASLSRQRLGASEQQLLALVNGTAAALKVQGTSAAAASGPLLQLGQALSGTNVQAEEYNSLIDGLPVLLQAAAKGSDRFGGDVARLTELVKGGKVTSQEFFQALLKGFPEIERQAAGSATTIGSALQTLDNQLGRYIGQADSGVSASGRLAQGIKGVADNLDKIIPAVTVLATIVGGRYAIALTSAAAGQVAAGISAARLTGFNIAMTASMTGATRAQVALNAAMAANPVGLVVTAVAALTAGLFLLATRYSSSAMASRDLDRVTKAADSSITAYAEKVDEAKAASGREREELLKKAEALREVTRARIADARVAAQKQIDEAVQARQRADASITAAGNRRAGQGDRSFSNASVIQDQAAGRRAQTDINLAVQARREADTALDALARLERAARLAAGGTAALNGGGVVAPAGGAGGGGTAAIRSEADKLDGLRRELAAVEERLLTDTERAAKELAETLATIRAAVDAGIITPEAGKRLGADATGRDIVAPQPMEPLDDLGDDAQRIAQAIREGADEQERLYRQAGSLMARDIVDVLASDNIWQAAGWKFREAAFENLEALLSDVFTGLFRGDAGPEGGLGVSIVKGIGALFGKRALGGRGQAGVPIVVGERRPEVFVPDVSGTVIPSVNQAMAQANRVRGPAPAGDIYFDLSGAVVTEDLIAQMNQIGQVARAGAVGDVAAAQAVSSRRAAMRTRRR